MSQNIYDDPNFFAGYATLQRSIAGLDGAPEWASLRALLPPLRTSDGAGINVLDLGCGYGWFSRHARQEGAAAVLALDVSERMLARARELTAAEDEKEEANEAAKKGDVIHYAKADLESLDLGSSLSAAAADGWRLRRGSADTAVTSTSQDGAFDLVFSALTFHYVKAFDTLLAKIFAALRPGGSLVFSAEHPIFTATARQEWTVDAGGGRCWPVSGYQHEGDRVSNWLAEGVVKQHRKLSTYVNALIAAGFVITHVDEWGPSAEQIAACPALAEEAERPMFFLLSARKPE